MGTSRAARTKVDRRIFGLGILVLWVRMWIQIILQTDGKVDGKVPGIRSHTEPFGGFDSPDIFAQGLVLHQQSGIQGVRSPVRGP